MPPAAPARADTRGHPRCSNDSPTRPARALHHNYIGTEHVLLGLLRVAERYPRGEFAATTLPDLGLDPVTARGRVLTEVNLIMRGDPPSR